jgi:hypothetical protein
MWCEIFLTASWWVWLLALFHFADMTEATPWITIERSSHYAHGLIHEKQMPGFESKGDYDMEK